MKLLLSSLFLLLTTGLSQDNTPDFSFQNTPLREAIQEIEQETGFRFLYRDELIAGKTVHFSAPADQVLEKLSDEILPLGIALRIDFTRRQVFLFNSRGARESRGISGRVSDAQTGEPLPFAVITWKKNGNPAGITAREDGRFEIPKNRLGSVRDSLSIRFSYLGYESASVTLSEDDFPAVLDKRLQPSPLRHGDVVITGTGFLQVSDSLWHQAMNSGFGGPAGNNTIRSLSVLPAVSSVSAFSGETHVRGSKTDGFEVLLDGVKIYNQHHLFGLFDAFNPDILRAVGFYYAITPAHLSGPPGATLNYLTRPGSRTGTGGSAAAGNAEIRANLHGPVNDGSGSWTIAGRYSLLGTFGWPGNRELLKWGLDVDRPNAGPSPDANGRRFRGVVSPVDESAVFYDFHAKGVYDFNNNHRLLISGYIGGNQAEVSANRIMRNTGRPNPPFLIETVETKNDWGNLAASAAWQKPVFSGGYLSTTAGFSRYSASYSKDDFLYSRPGQDREIQNFIRPFSNQNTLLDFSLNQTLDFSTGFGGLITAGHAFHQFELDYTEDNAFNPLFSRMSRAWQWDHFIHLNTPLTSTLSLDGGLRTHYFSDGDYFRLSPRLLLRLQPAEEIGFTAGYSRNYQFLHSLSLNHFVMADFWVMTNDRQGPAGQDNWVGGIYLRPLSGLTVQVEGYFKQMRDMRLPKINARALISDPDFDANPWFSENEMQSAGLEVFSRFRPWPHLTLDAGYTLSETRLRSENINRGEWYPAAWDRRHQFTGGVRTQILQGLELVVNGVMTSGAFNQLSLNVDREPERTGSYFRLDAGLTYKTEFQGSGIRINLHTYNVLNRQNTLYRESVFFADPNPNRPAIRSVITDVYDLGFIPSVEVSVAF